MSDGEWRRWWYTVEGILSIVCAGVFSFMNYARLFGIMIEIYANKDQPLASFYTKKSCAAEPHVHS